jgi:uncharacterized protein YjiS (DUF1127 family)
MNRRLTAAIRRTAPPPTQPRAPVKPPVVRQQRAGVAAAAPALSVPDLTRLDASFNVQVEIANAQAIVLDGTGSDMGWFALRGELTRLNLFEGFDDLLCLPALRGVDRCRLPCCRPCFAVVPPDGGTCQLILPSDDDPMTNSNIEPLAREMAENICRRSGMLCEWTDAGNLRVKNPARAVDFLLRCHDRARQRRILESLDDGMLHDLGLSRADVMRETTKHFWRD